MFRVLMVLFNQKCSSTQHSVPSIVSLDWPISLFVVEYTEFRQEQTDWLVELVMLLSFRLCCSMHDHVHQWTCYYCWLVGDQGDAWRRGYIDLGFKAGRKRTFQIVIEGRIDGIADKHYYKSDMALDDILVYNSGSCSQDQGTPLYQGSLLSDYIMSLNKNPVDLIL